MTSVESLRSIGLFHARAPRYTSYPPANHFAGNVSRENVATWLGDLPAGAHLSLYVHIPYCRRLCWFCACRTQGTQTDRPLIPYLRSLRAEMDLIAQHLPQDVSVSQIHLGGGTPTLLSPEMLTQLSGWLKTLRPLASDLEFSVEIDPTEVDAARIDALAQAGMTRASIGVQDFDPIVQDSIGRQQSYEQTANVVDMLRFAGVSSLNMDMLYGLPFQTTERMADTVEKLISLRPDRIALYGYAHVPWMAKRQVMIPAEELPDAEARLGLFDVARHSFVSEGYEAVGIDHFARPDDKMAIAARNGTLRRNFQGYTVDPAEALIGMGASAISRYPQGYAQNHSASSAYSTAIEEGTLATARGHRFSEDDRLRADMIEQLMCQFAVDLPATAARQGQPLALLQEMADTAREGFEDWVTLTDTHLHLSKDADLVARLVAQKLDAYDMPDGRHSRAL